MADLKRFARNIRVRSDKLVKNIDQLVRKVALAVDTAVVIGTPVDTGRARANWQVGLGSAPDGTLPAPSSPEEGLANALSAGQVTIGAYKGGTIIHITNNLPYIEALNNGHSSQAPAGYVEKAVAAGVDTIRGAAGRIL